jgi:hypothetical protein
VRRQERQQAQFGGGQRRGSSIPGASFRCEPGTQVPGLADESAHVGPDAQDLVDFSHQGPGPSHVGQREADADELDPSLDG